MTSRPPTQPAGDSDQANGRTKYSPPEIAKAWGITPEKVLAWIKAGELRATNVALKPNGRPRWRVDRRDLEAFELRRSAIATPRTPRRRRAAAGVTEYF